MSRGIASVVGFKGAKDVTESWTTPFEVHTHPVEALP